MLHLLLAVADRVVSPEHYGTIIAGLVLIALLHSWARGASLLDREEQWEAQQVRAHDKDRSVRVTAGLHEMAGRVVLVATGGMSSTGLVVIAMLAHQGAHVIVLVPDLSAPDVVQMILLLRESSRNENIYAEACDMTNMDSITAFSKKWFTGKVTAQSVPGNAPPPSVLGASVPTTDVHRLDTLLFLPSTEGVSPMGARGDASYVHDVLGPFHLVQSLLPSLQQQPPTRDVRVVTAVSAWYAAGLARFDAVTKPYPHIIFEPWTFTGASALHALINACEWQRKFDLLARADERPRTRVPGIDEHGDGVPVDARRSHISSVVVCPGFETTSQLSAFFQTRNVGRAHAVLLWVLWLVFLPLFWVIGRPTQRAADAVVWAVCAHIAPETPRVRSYQTSAATWPGIEPGHAYRDGRVLTPPMPPSVRSAGAAALWQTTEAAVEARIKSA